MAYSVTESENSTNASGKKMNTGHIREWEHETTLPADAILPEDESEMTLSIAPSGPGTFRGRFSSFDGFTVSQVTFQVSQTVTCTCGAKGQTVGMFFTLSGSCAFRDSQEGPIQEGHIIEQGQHAIYAACESEGKLEITPTDGQMRCLSIKIPVNYYKRLFSGHSALQDEFIKGMETRRTCLLPGRVMPMTLPMKWIINTIHTNARTGIAKQLFLHAKVHELLLLQVEQAEVLSKESAENPAVGELEALFEAKTILERSLDDPPTIRHLARMVGINEFTLKKQFKDTFHETIYGFVSRLKMEQARQMLLTGDKAIGAVAVMAGYKNPQHFTAAFKKYFGVLPSKLKA